MPDPRLAVLDVETLRAPSSYPPAQLAQALVVANACHKAFGAVRFLYAQEPHA